MTPRKTRGTQLTLTTKQKDESASFSRRGIFPFLDLPVELRWMVYDQIFAHEDSLVTRALVPSDKASVSLVRLQSMIKIPICFVSRQLHEEVTPYICANTTVHVFFGLPERVLDQMQAKAITRGSGANNRKRFNLRGLNHFRRFSIWPVWYPQWDTTNYWDGNGITGGGCVASQPRLAGKLLSNIFARPNPQNIELKLILDHSFWRDDGEYVQWRNRKWSRGWSEDKSVRCRFLKEVAPFATKLKDGKMEVLITASRQEGADGWYALMNNFLDTWCGDRGLTIIGTSSIPV